MPTNLGGIATNWSTVSLSDHSKHPDNAGSAIHSVTKSEANRCAGAHLSGRHSHRMVGLTCSTTAVGGPSGVNCFTAEVHHGGAEARQLQPGPEDFEASWAEFSDRAGKPVGLVIWLFGQLELCRLGSWIRKTRNDWYHPSWVPSLPKILTTSLGMQREGSAR